MENIRIAAVKATAPYMVSIDWKPAGHDHVDLSGWIATGGPLLETLLTPSMFATAEVAEHGTSIAWAGDDDLRIDAVHLKTLADAQRPLDTQELVNWQSEVEISNREAADLMGVSLSTWNNYRAGMTVPTAVQMIIRAVKRDPIIMQAYFRPRRAGRPPKEARA